MSDLFHVDVCKRTPVSTFVSKVGNDSPECVKPLDEKEAVRSLFNFASGKGKKEEQGVKKEEEEVVKTDDVVTKEDMDSKDVMKDVSTDDSAEMDHAASETPKKRKREGDEGVKTEPHQPVENSIKEEERKPDTEESPEPQPCPLCGTHLPPNELEKHVQDELERLDKATDCAEVDGVEDSSNHKKPRVGDVKTPVKGVKKGNGSGNGRGGKGKSGSVKGVEKERKGIEKFFKPANPE